MREVARIMYCRSDSDANTDKRGRVQKFENVAELKRSAKVGVPVSVNLIPVEFADN